MQIRLLSVGVASTVALILFGTVGAWVGGAHKVNMVMYCFVVSLLQPFKSLSVVQLRASLRVLLGGWLAFGVTYLVGRLFGEGAA